MHTAIVGSAQTTAFKYQGKLNDGGTAASGSYLLQFRLFDAPSGGTQIGSTISDLNVNVVEGIFAAQLDFGTSPFTGAGRYLEISVRRNAGESYTALFPREQITSSPYSVRTLSAQQADFATNAGNANTANSAITATSFTGNLAGDVTGPQTASTVARLQGRNVASTAPANGQVLKYDSASAQWRPDTDNTGSGGGGGTITGVTAGTGLTGGGSSGTVTVGIAPGGVGPTELANNAVTTAKIADANVTNSKIADVAGSKITGSITTATISGANVTGAVANATTAVNLTGSLAGDVTGTQSATSIVNSAVTTAKIADSAVTAQKIGAGQVVKSVNTLKDDVTLAAGTNITITPAGNTLTIAATGAAGGVTGSGTTNAVPLWNGATAIGNSLISQSAGEIFMPSVVRFAPNFGFQTNIGTPNSSTGITFSSVSTRADIRYNGVLTMVNGLGGVQGPSNGISINTAGNVGIGAEPFATGKLQVQGGVGQPGVYAQTDNRAIWGRSTGGSFGVYGESETGIGIQGVSLNGGNNGVVGQSSNFNGVFGNSVTGSGVRGNSSATNASVAGVYGVSTGAGGVGVKGEGTTGVYGTSSTGTGVTGESFSATGYGVYASNSSGTAIYSNGNLVQPGNFGGIAKAMLYVNPFLPASQYIVRCYNGVTGQSTGGCGFTVTRLDTGSYRISLGAGIVASERFYSIQVRNRITMATNLLLRGYVDFVDSDVSVYINSYDDENWDTQFWIIVY